MSISDKKCVSRPPTTTMANEANTPAQVHSRRLVVFQVNLPKTTGIYARLDRLVELHVSPLHTPLCSGDARHYDGEEVLYKQALYLSTC